MLRKWIKGVGIFILVIVLLLAGLLLFLHTDWGKSIVKSKVESFLQKKWKTQVYIGEIDYRLPDWLSLGHIVILDKQNDTLLRGGRIYVGVKMLRLISGSIEVSKVSLEDIALNCRRSRNDSAFNFQFIIDAFASSDTISSKPAGKKPLLLSVKRILLNKVSLVYKDERSQFYISGTIGYFSCLPSTLYPDKKIFYFNEADLRRTYVSIVDSSIPAMAIPKYVIEKRPAQGGLFFTSNRLGLRDIDFSFRQPFKTTTNLDIRVDSLEAEKASADLGRQNINCRKLLLNNSSVHLTVNTSPVKNVLQPVKTSSVSKKEIWRIKSELVTFQNNSFGFHNTATKPVKGLDLQHFDLKEVTLQMKQSAMDSGGMSTSVDIQSLTISNKLHVKQLTADAKLTDSICTVNDLKLAINESQLNIHGAIVWQLKPAVYKTAKQQFQIKPSWFRYSDILLVQPTLKERLPVSLQPTDKIFIAGKFTGSIQNFSADKLKVHTSSQLFQFEGAADMRLKKNGIELNVSMQQLLVKKQILSKELQQQFQRGLNLPDAIALSGKIEWSSSQLRTDLKMNTSFGQLNINGTVKNFNQPSLTSYDVATETDHFDAGKLIRLDSLFGNLTGRINIQGIGLSPDDINVNTEAQIKNIVFHGYSYSSIEIEAEMHKAEFTLRSHLADPNLEADLNIGGRISPDIDAISRIQISRADLLSLGFVSDTLVVSSTVTVNTSIKKSKEIHAILQADSTLIFTSARKDTARHIAFTCDSDADSTSISVNTPFVHAMFKSNFSMDDFPVFINSFKDRILLSDTVSVKGQVPDWPGQQAKFDLMLADNALIKLLIPGLELRQPFVLSGSYTAVSNDSFLLINASAPDIHFNQYEAHNLEFSTQSKDSLLQFSLLGKEVFNGSKLLKNASVTGTLMKQLLTVKSRVEDSAGKEFYSASVLMKRSPGEISIKVPDDLVLNYNKWEIDTGNKIRILPDGYIVDHLLLENRHQLISVNSKQQQDISPIDIKIDSFDISNVFALIAANNDLNVRGILNADITVQQPIHKIPIITGDLQANNLEVYHTPLGSLIIHSITSGDSLSIKGDLNGPNQVDFNGHLNLIDRGIDLETHLNRLDLSLMQGFTKDFLSRLSGNITGAFSIKGFPDTLHYGGVINLDSIAFAVQQLNTLYKINQQKLILDDSVVRFNQFMFTDSSGHPLTVQGRIALTSLSGEMLNLDIATKGFTALNAPRRPKTPLYGVGNIDARIQVRGAVSEPVIDGNIDLLEKSSVHFILLPQTSVSKVRKDGIVFVNIDTIPLPGMEVADSIKDSAQRRTVYKGLQYNLDIRVDKNAEFSIIIDPATSDELVAKGEGRLNAGLDKNGNMGLSGVYNLQSGYYKMNNLLLRGKFMLVKGSSISFDGDPMAAVADVTTNYEVEASPKGLLNYKDADNADYPQRVHFLVVFMIKGPVSKPVLSFDIQLKDKGTELKSSLRSDIEHELMRLRSNVTEMNKQVFSLLLTKRFAGTTGDNSLESSNLNANNALKEGISSFLTEAMNQAADQLIKGVDVDVNMKTYKSGDDPISKTDLGVAMSKDLFEDRLVIRVEENFAVGNNGTTPPKSGTQYIPDITSTYKLSRDGRLQVKAYQKNEYDAVVQGYFTEVGVSFTIELSYDKFMEIVRRRKNMSRE